MATVTNAMEADSGVSSRSRRIAASKSTVMLLDAREDDPIQLHQLSTSTSYPFFCYWRKDAIPTHTHTNKTSNKKKIHCLLLLFPYNLSLCTVYIIRSSVCLNAKRSGGPEPKKRGNRHHAHRMNTYTDQQHPAAVYIYIYIYYHVRV